MLAESAATAVPQTGGHAARRPGLIVTGVKSLRVRGEISGSGHDCDSGDDRCRERGPYGGPAG